MIKLVSACLMFSGVTVFFKIIPLLAQIKSLAIGELANIKGVPIQTASTNVFDNVPG